MKVTVTIDSVRGATGRLTANVAPAFACEDGVCTAEYPLGTDLRITAAGTDGALFQAWATAPCPDRFDATCALGTLTQPVSTRVTFRPPINYAFVSSTPILAGDIGSDLRGADRLCDSLARRAGLVDTPTDGEPYFKALLSTTSVSARSRLAGAEGWIRVDGEPFANRPADLFADPSATKPYEMFYPLGVTEEGTSFNQLVFTGSNSRGAVDDNCANFTVSTFDCQIGVLLGASRAGADLWVARQSNCGCNTPRSVYCFETAQPLATVSPRAPSARRVAFVSAGSFTATSGRSQADAMCVSEASAAGLPGTFLALLPLDAAEASARFDPTGANWVRPDNVAVASSPTEFMAGRWQAPLVQLASGSYAVTGFVNVWVGSTAPTALPSSASACANWSSSGTMGRYALSASLWDGYAFTLAPCSEAKRVYCVQQ